MTSPDEVLLTATSATRQGALDEADRLAHEALGAFRLRVDDDGRMRALNLLGAIAFERGNTAVAAEQDRSPGRREAPECLRASLSRPRLLETITIGELSMTPIVADRPRGKPAYSLFAHAARDGTAWINEGSDSGVVAKLLAVNDGDQPVLLVDGDQLVGAKQNRMINLTVLVAAKSQLELPVTCIEAGRWSYRSRRFDPGDDFVHSELRRAKMDQVNRAMRSGSRHADQGAVWNEVGDGFRDECLNLVAVQAQVRPIGVEIHKGRPYADVIERRQGHVGKQLELPSLPQILHDQG